MSMRGFIGTAVIATLMAGCGVAGEVDQGGRAAEDAYKQRCPDPTTDCTVNNGAGVYTEEKGFAGIGPQHHMITHWMNVAGGGVQFGARYYDASTATWQVMTSSPYYANYGTLTHLTVRAVKEGNTVPAWSLYNPATNTTFTVGDSQLLNLQIIIQLDKLYTIDWDAVLTDTDKVSIRKYNMRWRETGTTTPTQYCFRADASKDQVVFQGGMAVNPVSAMVTRNATTANWVTMSCRYGAIAQVRLWGYPYRPGTNTFYFDAGLHMKRASYCGDGNFYTHAGTKIRIWDNQGIQTDPMTTSEIEAWWTPNGATCIGPMRHSAMGFTGVCNGVPLPPCSGSPTGALADAASPPAP